MTLCTERLGARAQLETMRFMAVAAGNAGAIHLALAERTVNVYLILDLPIGVVQPFLEQCRKMRVV